MKRPKKLTYAQKKILEREGLEPAEWSLIHESRTDLQIIKRGNSEIRVIPKERTSA